MKIRTRKLAALLLTVSLLGTSGLSDHYTYAEEPAETAAVQEETTPPETAAPETAAPETAAPETAAPETAAPETAAPETAAPETAAPETQAPAETQAAPAAEPSAPAATEAAKQEQSETEKEKTIRSFKTKLGSSVLTVTLPKGSEVPESAVLSADFTKFSKDAASSKKAAAVLQKQQRVVAGGRSYTLTLTHDGKAVKLPKGTKVEYVREAGLDLEPAQHAQAKYQVLDMSGKSAASLSADVTLNAEGTQLKKVTFTADGNLTTFAIVATVNRANDGKALSRGDLQADLKAAAEFAVVADAYDGALEERVLTSASERKEEEAGAADLLGAVRAASVRFANAQSGDGLAVVNVYADEAGTLLTDAADPQDVLKPVLTAGGQIDVTGRAVVINVVALSTKTTELHLPHYDVVYTEAGEVRNINRKENTSLAGRVVYNFMTLQTGTEKTYTLVPFTGSVVLEKKAVGTFLAPEGSLTFEKALAGAAYAKHVTTNKKVVPATVTEELPKETEASNAAQTEAAVPQETKQAGMETEEDTAPVLETEALDVQEQAQDQTTGDTPAYTFINALAEGTVLAGLIDGASATNANLSGATLGLYTLTDIAAEEYKIGEDAATEALPANTCLKIWTVEAEDADISALIVPGKQYVLKVISLPDTAADYTKPWDTYFECKTDTETNTTTVYEITASDQSEVSGSTVVKKAGTTYSVKPTANKQDSTSSIIIPVGVCDTTNATATPAPTLGGMVIQIQDKDGKVLHSFDSVAGSYANIDLKEFVPDTADETAIVKIVLTDTSVEDNTADNEEKIYIADSVLSISITLSKSSEGIVAYSVDAGTTPSGKKSVLEETTEGGITKTSVLFKVKKPNVQFTVASYLSGTNNAVGGTVFKLVNGSDLTAGEDYTVTGASISGSKVTMSDTQPATVTLSGEMSRQLYFGMLNSIQFRWLDEGPAGYYWVSGTQKIVSISKDSNAVVGYLGDANTFGTINITKYRRISTEAGNPATEQRNYYFKLFRSANLNDPVPNVGVQSATVSAMNYTGTASFSNLPVGTYYLAEVNSSGALYSSADESKLTGITYSVDQAKPSSGVSFVPITITKHAFSSFLGSEETYYDNHSVVVNNYYSSLDARTATIQIVVKVVDSKNKPLASNVIATFHVNWPRELGSRDRLTISPDPEIALSNATQGSKGRIRASWYGTSSSIPVRVRLDSLKDASTGEDLLKSNAYTLVDNDTFKALRTRIQEQTVQAGASNAGPFTFTLKKVDTTQETAELTLTKAVTYKKTPIRVNATYYIGIFTDAAHKKLLYKKPMSLSNASSLTSTLKINLYKLPEPHTITLYFAETDKNGKVVSSGKSTGYNITVSNSSVTLSPSNATATVVVTNDVLDGSVAAANLTNPNSGFAGDSSALAEAQALAESGNLSANKKTGDDTPFERYALSITISAAALALLTALGMLRKRRRR